MLSRVLSTFCQPGRTKPASVNVGNVTRRVRYSSTHLQDPSPTQPRGTMDPYTIFGPEIHDLRKSLLFLLGSAHPSLTELAQYYFLHPSKQLRPLLTLLFSQATNGLGENWKLKKMEAEYEGAKGHLNELDRSLSRLDVLNDWNPNMPDHTSSFQTTFSLTPPLRTKSISISLPLQNPVDDYRELSGALLPTQMRLAQIVEMIHVASLLHDDVVDKALSRRGKPSAPSAFGNKLSVLAGDFLLGRASAALARLGEIEVVELISSVIANLVEGEILQMDGPEASVFERGPSQEMWNIYLKRSYLKTASLMAKGSRAAVILGGAMDGEIWKEVAYAYGRNIGIAFQLIDDVLDYEIESSALGKPSGADLALGLATGPALYAWEEHEAMGPLIHRKFKGDGDLEQARDLVKRSSGVERTRELALLHAQKARDTLQFLPESDARTALDVLTLRVVDRTR